MCEHCEGHNKVKVHLVDDKNRPALISYGVDASLADVANDLGLPDGRGLGVIPVRSPLTAAQSHPRRLHRVHNETSLATGVSIEELL